MLAYELPKCARVSIVAFPLPPTCKYHLFWWFHSRKDSVCRVGLAFGEAYERVFGSDSIGVTSMALFDSI